MVYLKIDVVDCKDEKMQLGANSLEFTCKSDGHDYALNLELYGEIDPPNSKWQKRPRYIEMCLHRKEKGEYWPRLLKVGCVGESSLQERTVCDVLLW